MRIPALVCLSFLLSLGACAGEEDSQFVDPDKSDLLFVPDVKVGDIILTNSETGRGCWYLNRVENWLTQFRYCHAMLVIERHGETGITTVEALNEDDGVQIMESRERSLSAYTETKIAVLRVLDEDGQPLSADVIEKVIDKSLEYTSAPYISPPIAIDGDPDETGIYCSMLPYRAYLDVAGIDLDGWFPLIVTPDELYKSDRTGLVYESAPGDMP